jgi:hypothetical protein
MMEKGVLLALVISAAFAGCLGGDAPDPIPTGQIDGAVVNHVLQPFADQTVYLSELGLKDQSSRLGGFTFRQVPVGSYTLIAAHEGTRGAVAVVDVEADRISKVILQLMPIPTVAPTFSIFPHSSFQDYAFPNTPCEGCSWTVELDERTPAEVVFEADWQPHPLGLDGMRFEVTDDRGDILYQSPIAQSAPVSIAIQGADIPAGTTSLHVTAAFGDQFAPRANFGMDSAFTVYYGATKAELFHQA